MQLQPLHFQARDAADEAVDHGLEALDLVLDLRQVEREGTARENRVFRGFEHRDGQILAADRHVIADLVKDPRNAGLRRESQRQRMRVLEVFAAADDRLIDRVDARVGFGREVALDAAAHAPMRHAPPRGYPVVKVPARMVQVVSRGCNVAGIRRIRVDAFELEHSQERPVLVEHQFGRDHRGPGRDFLYRTLGEHHLQHGSLPISMEGPDQTHTGA
ncbi:hypothetical protein [Caballeronia novacaledonica]|uniref:Uncharacterized protein n=1 Tax=Caballeronia novacaledonica TaxID=1544861 RepID=A0AA37MQT4_9BURK|nr:hypothetical protein [Caballeronia novacaledonica]GJH26896.1 hypothetical protein CBA19CS42_20290 [Caballeronia novacaledonica]